MEKEPIILGKQIGSGAEHLVYMIGQDLVGKIRSIFGSIWQTLAHKEDSAQAQSDIMRAWGQIRESIFAALGKKRFIGDGEVPHLQKCVDACHRHEIEINKTTVLSNIYVLLDGVISKQPILAISPFIVEIEKKGFTLSDLLGRHYGPNFLRQTVSLVGKGESLYHENLGLDLLGGKVVPDSIRAATQIAATGCQQNLVNLLESSGFKAKGSHGGASPDFPLNNVIKMPNERGEMRLMIPDPGMHDFSVEGRFKPVTLALNHMAFASLIEALKKISTFHGERGLSREEYLELDGMHRHIPPARRAAAKRIIETLLPDLRAA